jgi:RNA 2',3'-cyclic 3'-phosphodiesterase
VRLFIAVNLPEDVRLQIYAATLGLRQAASGVRWVLHEQFHVTVKFLGEVAEDNVVALQAGLALAARAQPPFDIDLAGIGAFPNLRRPRVYWLGITQATDLHVLQGHVESEIEPLGFPREARPFHPHVTLGRVGTEVSREQVRAAERAAAGIEYQYKVRVNSVDLMVSRLSPKGARYEVLRSQPLRAGN